MSDPLFIVFEGIDGSGTSTQCNALQRRIEQQFGYNVVTTREPGGTPIAERIRLLVLDPELSVMTPLSELLLYAASRAQHVRELIEPALRSGKPVICDRFTASTVAYQGYGRGLSLELIDQLNEIAVGGCRPDLTIFLDLPVEQAQSRCAQRGTERDRLEMVVTPLQEQVRAAYLEIAQNNADVSLIIDAAPTVHDVTDTIIAAMIDRWSCFPFR